MSGLGALWWIPAVMIGASLLSFLVYGWDKRQARAAGWRVSEATLHLIDVLGGWPGGLLAQRVFRHKTRKTSFQAIYWVTVVVNLAAVAALVLWWPSAP